MVQLLSCSLGHRFQPIQEDIGFIFSVRREDKEHGYVIRELGDQDPIHNHEQFINHLDHVSRMLHIGPGLLVHMNHLEQVLQRLPLLDHGLAREHVRRDPDRQNCLTKIIDGSADYHPPDPSVKGTKAFLYVIFQYVEIFYSPRLSLKERIKNAGFVTHFLSIWRNFIFWHPDYKLKDNFVSNQCYMDLLISTHCAVILICYFGYQFPHLSCPLERIGSDYCEEFFSKNVQFIGNHPVFPFGQIMRNMGHMVRLNQLQADPNAPAFARAHIKQENVWAKQFIPVIEFADLKDYPAVGEEIDLWKEGMRMARELATELGMTRNFFDIYEYDGPEDPNDWFMKPFTSGDHQKLLGRLQDDTVDCRMGDNDDDDNDDSNDNHNGADIDIVPTVMEMNNTSLCETYAEIGR